MSGRSSFKLPAGSRRGSRPSDLFPESIERGRQTEGYLLRSKLTFWLILALILGVGGILLSKTPWMVSVEGWVMQGIKPMQSSTAHITDSLSRFFTSLARRGDLEAENERQRQEIEGLTQEIARLRELEFENQRLRVLLNYQAENPGYEFLPAAVIGRDPSDLLQRIIIDKGTEDGVMDGMVVVASGGLAGKVIKSYPTAARVLLITDPSSAVNAMIQDSRALGVVRGKPANSLTMEFVPQSEQVAEGDLVITSGLGGSFPKGLLIGRVVEIKGDDMDLFHELRIEPAVQFDRLEDVIVITNFTPIRLD